MARLGGEERECRRKGLVLGAESGEAVWSGLPRNVQREDSAQWHEGKMGGLFFAIGSSGSLP